MRAPDALPTVRPDEAAKRLASGASLLLDVREAFELDLARVPGALHIPMNDVPARLSELPDAREILVLCHHGVRSAAVARYLRARGIDAVNVSGGIDAWARDVDASVGAY